MSSPRNDERWAQLWRHPLFDRQVNKRTHVYSTSLLYKLQEHLGSRISKKEVDFIEELIVLAWQAGAAKINSVSKGSQ